MTLEPAGPPRLTPATIADTLGGDYGKIPDGYISFKGYLTKAAGEVHRLFLDDRFDRWLEVDTDDIAGQLDVPANANDPRSVIWIKRDARVTRSHAGLAAEMEDEGWGLAPGDAPRAAFRRRPPY